MRSVTSLILAILVLASALSAQERSYALVTHNKVSVMAGPNKPDAELGKASSGEVVEYLGSVGDFGKVRLPGGVVGYVARGRAAKPYVELAGPGEARVLVSRLKIRPQPNLDWPAMGTLEPNTRLIVLEEASEGWLKILAPATQAVYIHKDYLRTGGDQAALATTFANSDRSRRESLLASGKLSADVLARVRAADAVDDRLKQAEERLAARPAGEEDGATLRQLESEYEAIAAAAPEGSLARTTAEERLAYLRDRREAADKFDEARRRIESIEKDRAQRDARYQQELSSFRERKEREASEPKTARSRFLQYGIGELHPVLGEGQRPTYVLSKGLEQRYLVTSERYDLGEYHGKTIGVTGWEMLPTPAGKKLQRVEITRLEVLN